MSTDTVFFDWQGALDYEFVPHGQTVNKKFYIAVRRTPEEASVVDEPELGVAP